MKALRNVLRSVSIVGANGYCTIACHTHEYLVVDVVDSLISYCNILYSSGYIDIVDVLYNIVV